MLPCIALLLAGFGLACGDGPRAADRGEDRVAEGKVGSGTGAIPEVPPPREDFGWGIYQIFWGARRYPGMIDAALSELESAPHYIMFYRDLGRGFPRGGCSAVRDQGAIPIISLELWNWGSGGNYLPAIASGRFDAYFTKWARDARDYGGPVQLRFGFEMNGDWFSWGGQPDRFIECWHRVRGIFRREGADNVLWIWSPNAVSIPREDWNRIERYYPGDEEVDWVGLDGYNFGDSHTEWHRWESFREVFGPALALFEELYPDKPVTIAEFGSAPGTPGQKAEWIREAYLEIRSRPRIRSAIWFNLDKRREGEPDWRIASEPGALEVFNRTFANADWPSARPIHTTGQPVD